MKLRTAHVDLDESTDIVQVLAQARKLRVAWITGTGDLQELPENCGYLLWSSDSHWVAVRDDVPDDGELSNGADHVEFHHSVLGDVSLGSGTDDTYSDVDLVKMHTPGLLLPGRLQVTRWSVVEKSEPVQEEELEPQS